MDTLKKTFKLLLPISLGLLISTAPAQAQETEAERLHQINLDIGRCLYVMAGNFESDDITQQNSLLLYSELLKNSKRIVRTQLEQSYKEIVTMKDILGEDVLVGVFLAEYIKPDEETKAERSEQAALYSWDWKKANRQLWPKYGCVSVFDRLARKQ